MKPFGKNINIKKRNDEPTEKEVFLDIIQLVDDCWKRSNFMEEEMNLGISSYEESFYLIIENLIFLHYGEWKGNIILWWLFERLNDEGELLPIEVTFHEKEITEEHLIENPEQLWDLLKKIEFK
jgi:hypothetical protein